MVRDGGTDTLVSVLKCTKKELSYVAFSWPSLQLLQYETTTLSNGVGTK